MPDDLPSEMDKAPHVSSPFVPPLRTSAFPRAEAFLGGTLDVPSCPLKLRAGSEDAARWLLEHHRVLSALKLLSGPDGGPLTSDEARLLRFRCLVALKRYE